MYDIIDKSTYDFSMLPSWCCFREDLIKKRNIYKLSRQLYRIGIISNTPRLYWNGSSIISLIIKQYNKVKLECDAECSPFYLKNEYSRCGYSCKMIYL